MCKYEVHEETKWLFSVMATFEGIPRNKYQNEMIYRRIKVLREGFFVLHLCSFQSPFMTWQGIQRNVSSVKKFVVSKNLPLPEHISSVLKDAWRGFKVF